VHDAWAFELRKIVAEERVETGGLRTNVVVQLCRIRNRRLLGTRHRAEFGMAWLRRSSDAMTAWKKSIGDTLW